MTEKIYSLIDEWYNAIPLKVRNLIRIFSIILWIFMAIIITIYSFLKGRENAPVIGEDLHQTEIKERILKNQNLNRKDSIILPDLNELVQEEIPLKIESIDSTKEYLETNVQSDLTTPKSIQILPNKDELIFPEKQEPIPDQKNIEIEEQKNNPSSEFNIEQKEKNKKLDIIKIEN